MVHRRVPVLVAVVFVVMWSSGFVGSRLGTEHAPTANLMMWRFVIASVVLTGALVALRSPIPRSVVLPQVGIGLLSQALYLGPIVGGIEAGVPAGTTALIASLQPILVGALAGPLLGEVVRRRQWLGLAIGIAGVLLVVADDLENGTVSPVAYLLPVAGMAALSAGTLLYQREPATTNPLHSLTIHTVTTAVVFSVAATSLGQAAPGTTVDYWLAIGWITVLSGFGGYGSYLIALRLLGATKVSALLYLTPPTTMVWSYAMFGDTIGLLALVGLAVTAIAVWLVLAPRPRPRQTAAGAMACATPSRAPETIR